jgi:hypothetical protein
MFHRHLPNVHLHRRMSMSRRKKNVMNWNLQNYFLNHRRKKSCHYYKILRSLLGHPKSRNCLPCYGYCLRDYMMNSFLVSVECKLL